MRYVHKIIVLIFTLGRIISWRRFIAHAPRKVTNCPLKANVLLIKIILTDPFVLYNGQTWLTISDSEQDFSTPPYSHIQKMNSNSIRRAESSNKYLLKYKNQLQSYQLERTIKVITELYLHIIIFVSTFIAYNELY